LTPDTVTDPVALVVPDIDVKMSVIREIRLQVTPSETVQQKTQSTFPGWKLQRPTHR
jgi:hypothetical protein